MTTSGGNIGTIPATMGIAIDSGALLNIGAKSGGSLTIASVISGASAAGVNFHGINSTSAGGNANLNGTVILSGQSTYSGTTHLVGNTNGSILRLGVANALPVGTTLSFEQLSVGNVQFDLVPALALIRPSPA